MNIVPKANRADNQLSTKDRILNVPFGFSASPLHFRFRHSSQMEDDNCSLDACLSVLRRWRFVDRKRDVLLASAAFILLRLAWSALQFSRPYTKANRTVQSKTRGSTAARRPPGGGGRDPTVRAGLNDGKLAGATPTYGASGNLTDDRFHTYGWDAEGYFALRFRPRANTGHSLRWPAPRRLRRSDLTPIAAGFSETGPGGLKPAAG